MNKMNVLNQNYSTTKLCYNLLDDKYLDKNGKIKEEYKFKLNFPEFGIIDSKIPAKKDERFDTYLFLPKEESRKGEGGIRTKGYFKFSYENKDDKWWIVEDDKYIKEVELDEKITKDYDKLPLITIITVVYNGEKYLEETIQSVINQIYPNVEYIIIDGGSTDGTLDIIKKYEDKIDYWVSEKDKGIYNAMNKGLKLSNGKWINFMNVGDYFVNENVISKLRLENETSKVVYGNIKTEKGIKKQNKFKNLIYFTKSTITHQSLFIQKKVHNLFNLEYKISADYNLLIDLLNKGYSFKYKSIGIAFYDTTKEYMDETKRNLYNYNRVQEKIKIIKKFSFPYNIIGLLYYYIKLTQYKKKLK